LADCAQHIMRLAHHLAATAAPLQPKPYRADLPKVLQPCPKSCSLAQNPTPCPETPHPAHLDKASPAPLLHSSLNGVQAQLWVAQVACTLSCLRPRKVQYSNCLPIWLKVVCTAAAAAGHNTTAQHEHYSQAIAATAESGVHFASRNMNSNVHTGSRQAQQDAWNRTKEREIVLYHTTCSLDAAAAVPNRTMPLGYVKFICTMGTLISPRLPVIAEIRTLSPTPALYCTYVWLSYLSHYPQALGPRVGLPYTPLIYAVSPLGLVQSPRQLLHTCA
jgi:hypothetical protein